MVTLSAHNCGVKGDTWSKWNSRVCLWSQQSSRIGTQRERVCSDTFKQTNKWNTLSFNETQSQSERWETSEIPFVLCRPRIYFLQTSSCGDIQKHVCGFPHSSNTLFGINVQFVDFLKCKDFLYTRVLWMWLTGRLLQSRWFKFQKVLMLWNFRLKFYPTGNHSKCDFLCIYPKIPNLHHQNQEPVHLEARSWANQIVCRIRDTCLGCVGQKQMWKK